MSLANCLYMCGFVILKFFNIFVIFCLNLGSIVGGHILKCTETNDKFLTEAKNAVSLFWEAGRSLDIPSKL